MAQKNEAPALILALLITLGLLGGGFWWLTRSTGFNLGRLSGGGQTSRPAGNPPAGSPPLLPGQQLASFSQVPNVPSGLFSYGGSTTWAPVRGQIDPLIQSTFPQFQLRYTDPAGEPPGSSIGIRMLLQDQLAIAQSSRALTDQEYQQAAQRGFQLRQVPVALEGIAIAVHPDLNIPGLTLDQLKGIYTGQVTNWRQVGGPNLPITPLSRQDVGGTVEFFETNVLGGQRLSNRVRQVSTTTQALRDLANTPGGIYYASAPEVVGQCSIKPIALGREANTLIPPYAGTLVPAAQCGPQRNVVNTEAIRDGRYPLTRTLFVVLKQDNGLTQQAGEAYANLLLTQQGQDLLQKSGFVSIR